MSNKFTLVGIFLLILVGVVVFIFKNYPSSSILPLAPLANTPLESTSEVSHPLMVEQMRKKEYPGSEITIEQELEPGSNYHRYIASYFSEGLKIYGLLTVPTAPKPASGWPVIIFNHGYIPPEEYKTTERYVAYVDGFARNGYIVFKPDYRGHGNSEGKPEGAYFSPSYTSDVLNAFSSLKIYPGVNTQKIGMWGHSMGGSITLRAMVVSKDIKAGVIWAGVVGSYDDMLNNWRRSVPWRPSPREESVNRPNRQRFMQQYGTPEQNPQFWNSISPYTYLGDISGPIQLHHGINDQEVPWEFSEHLKNELDKKGRVVEYYTYPGADHNISGSSFNQAIQRSIDFFDKYL